MEEALGKVLGEANVTRIGFEANFTTFGQITTSGGNRSVQVAGKFYF